MNKGKERFGKLVISGSDTAKMLDLIEKALYQMTFLIQVPVNIPRINCIHFRRNCISSVFTGNITPNFRCAICPVSQNITPGNIQFGKQRNGFFRIMNLTAGQMKSDRVTKSVNNSMNFCVFTASAYTYILVFI